MADRVVRLSQTLSPFGVGAIYDVLGESFVAADISRWRKHSARLLRAPRLARALGVQELREAPTKSPAMNAPAGPGLPFTRFPHWLFCASCRRMVQFFPRDEVPGEPARCRECGSRRALVPMRFVTVCEDGHLDDVPWPRWAHSHSDQPDQKQCQRPHLRFVNLPNAGGGLASLAVRCDTCRAQRSLGGITSPGSLGHLNLTCRGVQPWQIPRPELAHSKTPEVLQRGASNVYFASTTSALDIPPESAFNGRDELAFEIRSDPAFEVIVGAPTGPIAGQLIRMLAEKFEVPSEDVEALIRSEVQHREGHVVEVADEDIEGAEWLAFLTPHMESDDRDRFITRQVALPVAAESANATSIFDPLSSVVQAVRLREVRALTGFSRLAPSNTPVAPDLGRGLGWLPALEVFGEGVFISLDEARVDGWEAGVAAQRTRILRTRHESAFQRSWLPTPTPRFVLLHTFAHLLIRQMAFESGYASASLTERIYARSGADGRAPMAGVLIYTAAGDQEGTLGGLVRQGDVDRLASTLMSLLERGAWCSSDPICRESSGQGVAALNLAACHACALLAETSCGYSNALLDRMLVVGSPDPGMSYFHDAFNGQLDQVIAMRP
jgi:hypothetical protein